MKENYENHVIPFINEMNVDGKRVTTTYKNAIAVLKKTNFAVNERSIMYYLAENAAFPFDENMELAKKVARYFIWWFDLTEEERVKIKLERLLKSERPLKFDELPSVMKEKMIDHKHEQAVLPLPETEKPKTKRRSRDELGRAFTVQEYYSQFRKKIEGIIGKQVTQVEGRALYAVCELRDENVEALLKLLNKVLKEVENC